MIRQPICVFMGHIDHGKTSIADRIRHSAVAKTEAGAITQMISSSSLSIDSIKKTCANLIKPNTKFTIPGLLLIDTPGHAAFTNLRKRGGNLADIAVLVVDINEGLMPQTMECIEILKQYKTPFVIALNKVDLVQGFRGQEGKLLEVFGLQPDETQKVLEIRLYEIVGKLFELGFQSDRFDRVSDYTRQVAVVPCSAKSGLGIPELLMVLIGLAQKFLESTLEIQEDIAKATVLEVREEKGIGTVLDVILYDGILRQGDTVVIGNIGEPIVTKIKSILAMEKGKLKSIKEVTAAAGIRISIPDAKDVIPGVPLMLAGKSIEETKGAVQAEVEEVVTKVENEGVIIKAESLGSLEALVKLLQEKNIPIKAASVGQITKKDITDASSQPDPVHKAILCFNIKSVETTEPVKIISHDVIYHIIEEYTKWVAAEEKRQESKALEALTRPAKIQVIRGCIFRQSNPAVLGVSVLAGKLKSDVELIKEDGSKVGTIKTMQVEKETVTEAERGKEVAISLPGVVAKRQVDEDDIMYVDVPEPDFRELKKYKEYLSNDELSLLREFAELKRKQNPVWGI